MSRRKKHKSMPQPKQKKQLSPSIKAKLEKNDQLTEAECEELLAHIFGPDTVEELSRAAQAAENNDQEDDDENEGFIPKAHRRAPVHAYEAADLMG